MKQEVVTRFAPSPTGFLHIGGARTALFNWLFAEANNGKMLLRIEDTDRKRSTEEAVDALLDGLKWLGIQWDGEPVSQYGNAERHREVAEALLEQGKAYKCYATPEELEEMREEAKKNKSPIFYDRRWRDKKPEDAPKDKPYVIRLKTPIDGETIVNDIVQGKVVFQNKVFEDFVLLRSDGTPTYMLAVVVDDNDMGVTHIIRGDDHLNNAAKQTFIYNAMEWDVPTMAHIPLIHGADGAKLSKRHGALGVEKYRDMGYLPNAVLNYLVRLGWSHGDQEIFGLDELKKIFTLEKIKKSPARIDFDKMKNMNGRYIRMTDDSELVEYIKNVLPLFDDGKFFEERWESKSERFEKAIDQIKKTAASIEIILERAKFLFEDPKKVSEMDEEAKEILNEDVDGNKKILTKVVNELETVEDWTKESTDKKIGDFCEREGMEFGEFSRPLRAALTSRKRSIEIFVAMESLGKDETLKRINTVIESL